MYLISYVTVKVHKAQPYIAAHGLAIRAMRNAGRDVELVGQRAHGLGVGGVEPSDPLAGVGRRCAGRACVAARRGLQYLVAHPVDAEPTVHSARELLTRFNEPGGLATTFASQVAEAARQQAAALPREDLVALFTVTAPEVVAAINAAGPIVVDYFGTARVPVEVPVSIATLEGVVHGLDRCASCDLSPTSIPPSSMDHTVQLLASMAPPVGFIEAATGRRDADVLPVLR